jgi:glycosyltransferase involved in cell wall biosynthesis
MLCSSFHPLIGGAESYALMIGSALSSRGHEVVVATDWAAGSAPSERLKSGVRIRRLSSYRDRLQNPDFVTWEQMYFGLSPELKSVLNDEGPIEVVIANSLDMIILSGIVSLDINIPLVASTHEQWPDKEPLGRGRCRLVLDFFRFRCAWPAPNFTLTAHCASASLRRGSAWYIMVSTLNCTMNEAIVTEFGSYCR